MKRFWLPMLLLGAVAMTAWVILRPYFGEPEPPPLPLAARAPYGALAATAVAMLPAWARMPLLLPYFPPVEVTVVRTVGRALVGGIRWALPAAG